MHTSRSCPQAQALAAIAKPSKLLKVSAFGCLSMGSALHGSRLLEGNAWSSIQLGNQISISSVDLTYSIRGDR